jgi:ATP-dependent Lon protease
MDVVTDASPETTVLDDNQIFVSVQDIVLMPGIVMPLSIGSVSAAAALQEAARLEQTVAVVLQREPFCDVPGPSDLYEIGTEARLLRYFTGRDGSHNAILQALGRLRIDAVLATPETPAVKVRRVDEPIERSPEIDARFHRLRERSLEILALIEQAPRNWPQPYGQPNSRDRSLISSPGFWT